MFLNTANLYFAKIDLANAYIAKPINKVYKGTVERALNNLHEIKSLARRLGIY